MNIHTGLRAALVAWAALGGWLPAAADPMRPLPSAASATSANASASASATASAAPTASPVVPEILAIRQDSRGRRQVLIGERWLAVGERSDKVTVAAIGENSVELMSAGRRLTGYLLPPLLSSPTHNADLRAQSNPR